MENKDYGRIIGRNLKRIAYINERSQAQISRDLQINKATISSWMNGTRIPKMESIDLLCHYFNCTREDIMNEHDASFRPSVRAASIPILGRVAAGPLCEMIEDSEGELILDYSMNEGYFALRIKGDSMSPRMESGDIVVVKKQPDIESGDLAIVAVDGELATCKRVKKYRDGIELIPINPSYPTRFFTHEEIQSLPVTIIGKVVELRAKF